MRKLFLIWMLLPYISHAEIITVTPLQPMQGEALLIQIQHPIQKVRSVLYKNISIPYMSYGTSTIAIVGVDLKSNTGTSTVDVTLDTTVHETYYVLVQARIKPTEAFTVPIKLGGNSSANQKKVASTLEKENTILNKLLSHPITTLALPFAWPLSNPVVTDVYGYKRDSGTVTITHKGTDFHAASSTPVLAMNSGVVKLSRKLFVYGNTVVIDHGNGIETLYMHLSHRLAHVGQRVEQGDTIAYSGSTGYAEHPHLHVSVRINHVSVDPIAFLNLFGVHI
jgi:murein DD-endopeptidase MepM/ murein hydrolase activator NlpD